MVLVVPGDRSSLAYKVIERHQREREREERRSKKATESQADVNLLYCSAYRALRSFEEGLASRTASP